MSCGMKISFFVLLLAQLLFAHQTGLSYIDITQNKDATLLVTYKKPLEDAGAKPIAIHYPQSCRILDASAKQYKLGFIIQHFTMWCGKNGMLEKRIWVEGLVRSDKGVAFSYKSEDFKQKALLRSTTPFVKVTKQNTTLEYMQEYMELGVWHILTGYDHLLFVLCMLLLAKNLKRLLFAVSAFTLAHSITLALAVFDLLSIPSKFVESMIALSIVFLARELLTKENTITKSHLEYIAFIFGLLHGLGFSNALKEIGLPHEDMVPALFSFNVGIELGQIMFIIVVMALFKLLHIYKIGIPKHSIAYGVGIVASFWFIERVAAF